MRTAENEAHDNGEAAKRALSAWNKDAKLRAEFGNDLKAYLAYERNEASGKFTRAK